MQRLRDLVDLATLLRWLGPWAGTTTPASVSRTERAPAGLGRAYLYTPRGRAPAGAYLITPGLHYLGPDDTQPRQPWAPAVITRAKPSIMSPW